MSLLIKNGMIVTASDMYQGDVFIDGERISTIGTSLDIPATADRRDGQVPVSGRHRRTHAPRHAFGGTTSADDFESGTIAARTAAPRQS